MSNAIVAYPAPEEIRYPDRTYYYETPREFMTPYENDLWQKTLVEYGIKMPFKNILTRDQGKSKCKYCGTVYGGYQAKCTKQIRWFKYKEAYHMQRGDFYAGDRTKDYPYVVGESKLDRCDMDCVWDKSEEFCEQQNFFRFTSWLASVPSSPGWIDQYKNLFPVPQVADAIEVRALRGEVDRLTNELYKHRRVIEEIVKRMSSAGQSLSFNL